MIPVSRPFITEDDHASVLAALSSRDISGTSGVVREFEELFAHAVQRKYAVAVSNGSMALDVALAALDLRPGDEVIIPSFTIASGLFAILRCGLTPVFCDSDDSNWNMTEASVRKCISPKTRAVIVTHTFGLAVDIDPILQLAKTHGMVVIEDAAEALGTTHNGEPCGSFGDVSIFSFFANKNITGGEGGILVSNSAELTTRFRAVSTLHFGKGDEDRFIHQGIGYNARMPGLSAALASSQLTRLSETTDRKREIGLKYREYLGHIDCVSFQSPGSPSSLNNYWVFGLLLEPSIPRSVVRRSLQEAGIETRPFFHPLHLQPVLMDRDFGLGSLIADPRYPVAERLSVGGFYLPSFPEILDSELEYVSKSLTTVLEKTGGST